MLKEPSFKELTLLILPLISPLNPTPRLPGILGSGIGNSASLYLSKDRAWLAPQSMISFAWISPKLGDVNTVLM
ncbi:hypothetical protein [Pedobacter sp. UC225_65]|uniref:hypothetical protein n=1 Tax=Pedobacter sp. UC225_65 TaxID=3350173 RepID=UPI00366FA692